MHHLDELEWDDWNTEHIWDEHKVDQAEAEQAVFDLLARMVRVGARGFDGRRYAFFGATDAGRLLAVVVHDRGNRIGYVTSARDMDDREKRLYRRKRGSA